MNPSKVPQGRSTGLHFIARCVTTVHIITFKISYESHIQTTAQISQNEACHVKNINIKLFY
jgi:hypothetical protein